MAENESKEGKNLALDQKKEFEARILKAIEDLKTGQTTISTEGIEVTNYDGSMYTIKLKGIIFCTIDEKGEFSYKPNNFKQLKKVLDEEEITLEELGLPDLEQAIDLEEKVKNQDNKEDGELHEEKNNDDEKLDEKNDEEELEEDIEKDKERIAKELEIEPEKIYPIRADSAFYNNHPGMFPGKNLFFFEDKQGNIKVGTRDENGRAIEDTEHFKSNEDGEMEPIIRLGDGRENVKEEMPFQMIGIKNPAKDNGDEDVHDRYIAVYIGKGGYKEFEEVEKSRQTGDLVGERIEIHGREYNTEKMNERTQNRSGGQTPGETVENYNREEERDNEVNSDEIFSDNETFKKQIAKDLTQRYGPMDSQRLEKMSEDVMERLEYGEHYDDAIARVGIEPRDEGGPARGDERPDPRRG